MCGRFSSTFSFRDIKVRWNLYGDLEFAPLYNIAPSQTVPVIVKGERGHGETHEMGPVAIVGAGSEHR